MGGFTAQPNNLSNTTPAAPSGKVNVVFQADAPTAPPTAVVRNTSAYMPPMTSTVGGAVPTPPNDSTKCLDGTGNWSSKGGGGGGSNDDISYYLSPSSISPPSFGSWAHQQNGSYSYNANGALVLATYSSTVYDTAQIASIPANDFDLIACFSGLPSLVSGEQITFGLAIWDSASGKIIRFNMIGAAGNNNPSVFIGTFSSMTEADTGDVSTLLNQQIPCGMLAPLWMRINYSYGFYTYYLSVDGQSWDQCYQGSALAYLPVVANECGVAVTNYATTKAHAVIPHFSLSSYVGS